MQFPTKRRPCWRGLGAKPGKEFQRRLIGIVIKVSLHQYYGRAFVAGAGGQIAERADEVGELTGRGALRGHVAHKVAPLGANAGRDGFPERFTREIAVVVVGQIFQFDFVGRADQPVGEGGRNNGVGQLPDFSLWVLEGAVTIDHDLHVLAGFLRMRA